MAKIGQLKSKTGTKKEIAADPDLNLEEAKTKTPLPTAMLDSLLDDIEVDLGISQVDVKSNRFTTSTGLLSLDLILSGGMVTGGWYTMFGGEQSSKCVIGSSLVPTNQGLLCIEDIFQSAVGSIDDSQFDHFYEVADVLEVVDHEGGLSRATQVVCNIGYTYEIRTQFGDRLIGLPDHKIQAYTDTGIQWQRLDAVGLGKFVPKIIGQQIYNEHAYQFKVLPATDCTMPTEMTEELAELFGWLVAKPRSIVCSKRNSPFQLERIQELVAQIFGERCTVLPSKNLALPKAVAQFVRFCLNDGLVPRPVLESPKPIQQAFLRSLFDSVGKIKDWFTWGQHIHFVSTSKELVYTVKAMLENMGILCLALEDDHVKWRPEASFMTHYVLAVHPEFNQIFLDQIGFLTLNKKRSQALLRLSAKPPKSCINLDLVPGTNLLRKLAWDSSLPQDLRASLQNALFKVPKHIPASMIPRSVVREAVTLLDEATGLVFSDTVTELAKKLRHLLPYYWSFVTFSRNTNKKELVYDLNVQGSHSYQVNGFIGHNSTLVMNQMARSIKMPIPTLIYADFEGCLVKTTKIRIGESYTELGKLIPEQLLDNPPDHNAFVITDQELRVDTVGGDALANLFYGGFRSVTKIITASGKTLEGSQHPVLVLNETGGADWKMIEDLKIGDTVLEDPSFMN